MGHFSRRTLNLLADELAGSWTLRTIEVLFEDAGVPLGPEDAGANESGARRALYKRYLASLDLENPRDHAKFHAVVAEVLVEIHDRNPRAQESQDWYRKWVNTLRRDGFSVEEATGLLQGGGGHGLTESALSALKDSSAIRDHLRRLGETIESDPRLAVSVSKDLVESTAKLVLSERQVLYGSGDTLPQLVARAQESLGLSAKAVESDTKAEEKALKTILGSLANLTQGVTELRNKIGVGHGRESVPAWVRPRHARLAAGAAQVWCQLMLETLDDPDAPWRTPR